MTSDPTSSPVSSTAGDPPPAAWPDGELNRLAAAEVIQISTRRADGALRSFVPIWIVAVAGNLYVRSYRGSNGAWYQHATRHPAGAIQAGEHQADITFTPVDSRQQNLTAGIDAAYRAKYARYGGSYLQPMLTAQAAATTLRLDPESGIQPTEGMQQ
jgi:hypothetical protein